MAIVGRVNKIRGKQIRSEKLFSSVINCCISNPNLPRYGASCQSLKK